MDNRRAPQGGAVGDSWTTLAFVLGQARGPESGALTGGHVDLRSASETTTRRAPAHSAAPTTGRPVRHRWLTVDPPCCTCPDSGYAVAVNEAVTSGNVIGGPRVAGAADGDDGCLLALKQQRRRARTRALQSFPDWQCRAGPIGAMEIAACSPMRQYALRQRAVATRATRAATHATLALSLSGEQARLPAHGTMPAGWQFRERAA